MPTRDEIVEGVVSLLRQHQEGSRGSIDQEPYRGDFFDLFAAAFNAGMMNIDPQPVDYLNADALAQIVTTRAPEFIENATLFELIDAWRDWTYAWKRVGDLEGYVPHQD